MTVFLEDDLEGDRADETVRFGIGGTAYEMDLNAKNAAAFRRQLAPYVEHAHGTGRTHGAGGGGLHPAGHGARTSGRGERPGHRAQRLRPIPADIRQYQAATGGR
jgi:Lsr2